MEGPPKNDTQEFPKFQRRADEDDFVTPLEDRVSENIQERETTSEMLKRLRENVGDFIKSKIPPVPRTDKPIIKSGKSDAPKAKPQKAKATKKTQAQLREEFKDRTIQDSKARLESMDISQPQSKESIDQDEPVPSPEASAVNESVEEAKNDSPVMDEKSAMLVSEKNYLDSYKQFYSKKGVLDQVNQFRHEILGHKVGGLKEVEKLKAEYDKNRLAYGKALDDSTFDRVGKRLGLHHVRDVYRTDGGTGEIKVDAKGNPVKRGTRVKREESTTTSRSFEERYRRRYEGLWEDGKMMKGRLRDGEKVYYSKGKEPSFEEYFKKYRTKEHAEKVMARYKNYVRFKEVIKPGAEKAYEARIEALDTRGENLYGKAFNWYVKANKDLEKKLGKPGARAVRAVVVASTGAVLMGGAALAGGTLSGAVIAGLAVGAGVKVSRSIAMGTLFGGTGAALGVGAGNVYEGTIARSAQKKAREKRYTLGGADALTPEALAELDKQRIVLISREDERTLQKKKAWVTAITSSLFGVGALEAASGFEGIVGSMQHGHVPDINHAPPAGHSGGGQDGGHNAAPSAPQAKEVSDSMTVGEKDGHVTISDGDKLIGHFAQKLEKHDQFQIGGHNTPPAIQKLFQELHTKDGASLLKGEDHAAHNLGLEGKGGISTVLQPGDKISFDHGQVVLDRPGHPELHHVLIDEKGAVHPLDAKQWHQEMPHHAHAAEHGAQHHEKMHDTESTKVESIKNQPYLTTDQLNYREKTEFPTGHDVAPEQPVTLHPSPSTSEATPPPSTVEPHVTEAGLNVYGVLVDKHEPHLYTVIDKETNEEQLVVYGGNADEHFMKKLQDFAEANPGKTIYFDSPQPTMVDGVEKPWIASATYDPQSGFHPQTAPVQYDNSLDPLIGRKLEPNTFTSEVQ